MLRPCRALPSGGSGERRAEDYSNNLTVSLGLESDLSQLRDQVRELASQDARELVERFGQMRRRKLQLAG